MSSTSTSTSYLWLEVGAHELRLEGLWQIVVVRAHHHEATTPHLLRKLHRCDRRVPVHPATRRPALRSASERASAVPIAELCPRSQRYLSMSVTSVEMRPKELTTHSAGNNCKSQEQNGVAQERERTCARRLARAVGASTSRQEASSKTSPLCQVTLRTQGSLLGGGPDLQRPTRNMPSPPPDMGRVSPARSSKQPGSSTCSRSRLRSLPRVHACR